MTGMADEDDMPSVLNQALRLAVDFRYERACRVDIGKAAVMRFCRHRLRDTMSREYHRSVVRDFVELVDEDRSEIPQPVHHESIVDDLMAHIDWGSEPLER